MPRRRHHWFAHRPQLFMRRHRRRLSSMRRHRRRLFMRHRRLLSMRHRRRLSMRRHRHRLSMRRHRHRSFARRQRRSTRHCAEIPDYRHAPSRHNQGVRPALKAHWGWPGSPLVGMLTYSALITLYLAYLGIEGKSGVLLWPAVVLHVILSALLVRASINHSDA
jgi:hypothetical protein